MARSYSIHVTGVEHAERTLLRDEDALHLALAEASEKGARLLHTRLAADAPGGHGPAGHRNREHEVFARPSGRKRRFFGAKRDLIYQIEVGVRDPSVSAFVEFGTGIYATPERRGPREPWTVRAENARYLRIAATDGIFYRKSVHIPGTRPHPWIESTVETTMPAVHELYRDAVRAAIG